jgi:hypothetical protein
MPTIQIETEQLLNAALQMPRNEMEAFVRNLLVIKAREESLHLDKTEKELLVKIQSQNLSATKQTRMNKLIKKRQSCTITQDELNELITLTDEAENLNVKRIKYLIELAILRNVSLDELIQQLGIKPVSHD